MTGALLRLATAADRPVLLDLWQEAWSAARPDIDFAARRPWIEARLDGFDRAGTLTALALDGPQIAGFVTVDPASRYIDQLAVRVSLQGRGWAGVLLDDAKRRSPEGLDLRVNQANHRAVALYRRHGFRTLAAEINEASGQPVWLMRWTGGRSWRELL